MKPDLIEGVILDRQIGAGATSTVYLAVSRDNPREKFAVKFLTAFLMANETAMLRWKREAELLTRLSHQHIVRGIRWGQAHGRPWLMMEFLQGESLMDRLRRKSRLGQDEVWSYARACLQALEAAAALNIVHRDIKPANIILTSDDVIKVTDFGLAKYSDDVSVTAPGTILGTPVYLSPEQAAGDVHITIQSDLYSLGTTLYHLVAGRPPFTELNTSLLLTRKITDDVADVRLANEEVGSNLAFLIRQLTARDLAARTKTPTDALRLMDQLESGELTTTDFRPEAKSSRAVMRPMPAIPKTPDSKILETVVSDAALNTHPVFLKNGEVLFYEDDESRECYLLVSGRVEILKSGRGIAVINSVGSFIGEMSPLNSKPRTATVVAREETVLLRIEEEQFNDFLQRHPDMAISLARSLAQRLEITSDRLNEANTRLALLQKLSKEIQAAFRLPLNPTS